MNHIDLISHYRYSVVTVRRRLLVSLGLIMALGALLPSPAAASSAPASTTVTYVVPDLSVMSATDLKRYYAWRMKMDFILAPIHTRAELKQYLKDTAKSGSPLDALTPAARQRFLSSIEFGPHGAGSFNMSDLQYLSTKQVYQILALFGEQGMAAIVTGDRIRPASPAGTANSAFSSSIQQHFTDYWRAVQATFGQPWRKRARTAREGYKKFFSSHQTPAFVSKVGDQGLRLLFRAAYLAASYTNDPSYANDARLDFKEMTERHFAGPPDYENMYSALIVTRQLSSAHKFSRTHADLGLPQFPAYRDEAPNADAATPTVLVVDAAKHELIRRRINLTKPAQVIVFTDPSCFFCIEFNEAFQARPKLRLILEQHAIWVAPPGSELEFDDLQKWNQEHPKTPISIVYNLKGWPMIKTIGVPRFYFLRHGKLVAKHIGWLGKQDFAALEAGLSKIGLWK